MGGRWMVYGATGYTGKLVASVAAKRGLDPILAGRNAEKTKSVAGPLGLESKVFSVDDPSAIGRALEGVSCLLNVAGPFSATARPVIEACLAKRVHYLDVTGEIDVFEHAASLDARAKKAGVMLLPGVGFDVVPSDCLAAHVAARVERPGRLRLAIAGLSEASRGTMKTMVEALGEGTRVRREGRIVSVPGASLTRKFDFGKGAKPCLAVSWGDVATAWHSTGIPWIEVYFVAAGPIVPMMKASRYLGGVLRASPVQAVLKKLVDRMPEGPAADELARGRSILVGEVEGADGLVVRSRLETPNGYRLTGDAAVEISRRVLEGEAKPGFQTPSRAFGADFVLGLPDCTRTDL